MKSVKGNIWKNNFATNIIFINCSSDIPGYPYSKKRHHLDERVSPPNLVAFHNLLKLYYNKYSTTDISNHFWQGGINLESYIHTSD